jgi:hypothetical protein
MSFASQPRKKKPAASGKQGDGKSPCCPDSNPKIIDFPTEKKKTIDLIHKINEKLSKDPKVIEKAAYIIGAWVNGNALSKKKTK